MSEDTAIKEAGKKENGIVHEDEDSITSKKKVQSDIMETKEKELEISQDTQAAPAKEVLETSTKENLESPIEETLESETAQSNDETNNTTAESEELKLSLDESKEEIENAKDTSLETSKEELDDTKESKDDIKDESLDSSNASIDEIPQQSAPVKGKKKITTIKQGEVKSKRERKKVERFSLEPKKDDELSIVGTGDAFQDIPFINAAITKTSPEDLKTLHRICFGRRGTASEFRKNLKKFNGLGCEKDDPIYKKKKATIEKLHIPELKKLLKICGIQCTGKKPELVEKVIDFLTLPKDLGRKAPEKKSRKRSKKQSQKRTKKPKLEKSKGESSELSQSEEEEESDSDQEEEEEEQEEPSPPKKAPKPKKKPVSKRPKSESNSDKDSDEEEEENLAKKTPKGKKAASQKPSKSEKQKPAKKSTKNDVPLSKLKKPQPPTDTEIQNFIKKLLDKANLEEVTMKKLCQQVYDNYPKFDLAHKKDFIKETVKSILS